MLSYAGDSTFVRGSHFIKPSTLPGMRKKSKKKVPAVKKQSIDFSFASKFDTPKRVEAEEEKVPEPKIVVVKKKPEHFGNLKQKLLKNSDFKKFMMNRYNKKKDNEIMKNSIKQIQNKVDELSKLIEMSVQLGAMKNKPSSIHRTISSKLPLLQFDGQKIFHGVLIIMTAFVYFMVLVNDSDASKIHQKSSIKGYQNQASGGLLNYMTMFFK